jgi:hypothetical protein
MSIEENTALVRRYLEEVVNAGEVDRLDEFIAPDYIDRNDQGRGIAGAKLHVLGVRQTYPDLHVTVGRQIVEGECGTPAAILVFGPGKQDGPGARSASKPKHDCGHSRASIAREHFRR